MTPDELDSVIASFDKPIPKGKPLRLYRDAIEYATDLTMAISINNGWFMKVPWLGDIALALREALFR